MSTARETERGTSPAIGLPLLHLAVLSAAFGGLALLGMRRFEKR